MMQIVDSPRYRKIFPHITLNPQVSARAHWETNTGCGAYFKGVGQGISGFRAHLASIDDPFPSSKEADSTKHRDDVWNWFTANFVARAMNETSIILTNTRFHIDDLNARIIEKMNAKEVMPWQIINLEAICTNNESDPLKRNIGEALWPEVYPISFLNEQKGLNTVRAWESLFQGSPMPDSGNVVDNEWLKYYDLLPIDDPTNFDPLKRQRIRRRILSVDSANKDTQRSDYSVIMLLVEDTDKNIYCESVFRKRMQFPELEETILRLAAEWRVSTILIEDGASGVQFHQRNQGTSVIPIIAIPTNSKSKSMRLDGILPDLKIGRVLFKKSAHWLAELVRELLEFPDGKHDDQVDALSQGVAWLRRVGNRRYGSRRLIT